MDSVLAGDTTSTRCSGRHAAVQQRDPDTREQEYGTDKEESVQGNAGDTKRRSKGDLVKTIAAGTDLQAAKVKDVLEALTVTMAADLGKKGCGEFNFNGLMTLKTVKKPATKARPGRNPFTGEAITIKAKPASRKVRVRALRGLNALI